MNTKLSDNAALFSRRALLQAAAGAAAILGAAGSAAAQIKVSRASVAYQDQPDSGKRCGICAHFVPPGMCRIVQGPISPQGYCTLFTPASQNG
jgi:hypothetical protein